MSIVLAVLILGLIILFHEFGHFLFAKLSGICVVEFSLGMGPRLLSFQKGETRYSFKLLPFGGSCAMLGEDGEESDQRAFGNKPVLARILVVAAGPVFNFILAFAGAAVLVAMTGFTTPRLQGVAENSPAQAAGLEAGDVIRSVNGRSIHSYNDFVTYLFTHGGRSLDVVWQRDGRRMEAEITPAYSQEQGGYLVGVYFDAAAHRAENLPELLLQSFYEVEYWIRYVFDSFYMMFHGMVSMDDLSGPVGIVAAIDTTVEAAAPYGLRAVFLRLIQFSVLLSANLGVMNLLPIPALDGGRLVFLLLEALRGRPIDREKEGMVHMAGMALLLGLMAVILLNDVRKLF